MKIYCLKKRQKLKNLLRLLKLKKNQKIISVQADPIEKINIITDTTFIDEETGIGFSLADPGSSQGNTGKTSDIRAPVLC